MTFNFLRVGRVIAPAVDVPGTTILNKNYKLGSLETNWSLRRNLHRFHIFPPISLNVDQMFIIIIPNCQIASLSSNIDQGKGTSLSYHILPMIVCVIFLPLYIVQYFIKIQVLDFVFYYKQQ